MTRMRYQLKVFVAALLGAFGGILPAAGCTGGCGACFGCAGLGGVMAILAALGMAAKRSPAGTAKGEKVVSPL